MLMATPAAAAALATLLEAPEVPDGAVVRIAGAAAETGEQAIALTVVEDPPADDEVVELGDGLEVFVEPGTADVLDDKQLDVEVDGDRLSFTLQRQSVNGGPPHFPPTD